MGTDHSVPTRNALIVGSVTAVDRAVCPHFQQAPSGTDFQSVSGPAYHCPSLAK
jgi:hypothetical protein